MNEGDVSFRINHMGGSRRASMTQFLAHVEAEETRFRQQLQANGVRLSAPAEHGYLQAQTRSGWSAET